MAGQNLACLTQMLWWRQDAAMDVHPSTMPGQHLPHSCTLTFTYTVSFVIAPRLSVVWSKRSVPKACMLFCTLALNTAFCLTMDMKGSATPLFATA